MDPLLLTVLVAGGIFAVSFILGRNYGLAKQERIIEATIDHLITDGYLAATTNADGDVVLIPISELSKSRRKR